MFFFFLLSLIELLWFIFYSRSDFGFIPVCVHTHRAIASAAAAAVAASFKEIKERGTHRTYVRRSWQRKNSLYFINMQSVVSVWFSHFFSFLLILHLHCYQRNIYFCACSIAIFFLSRIPCKTNDKENRL